jgi:hypothetical protein
MGLDPHETTLPKMDLSAIIWAYYRQLLKQTIPDIPDIISVEEIEAEITIFTSTIKTEKTLKTISYIPASRLCHSRSRGTIAKKKARKKNMHSFNSAADRREYSLLRNYIHSCLKQRDSKI